MPIYLMYLCKDGIKIGIAHAGTQPPWAYGNDPVNFPDAGIWSLNRQSSAAVPVTHSSAVLPSGAKRRVS